MQKRPESQPSSIVAESRGLLHNSHTAIKFTAERGIKNRFSQSDVPDVVSKVAALAQAQLTSARPPPN